MAKYFEDSIFYTDGFLVAKLTRMRNGYFYGYVIDTSLNGRVIGLEQFRVSVYGSLGRCREEALKSLKNGHFKKML